jgi:glyceraldehyde 3-phosphate dehydrogenase
LLHPGRKTSVIEINQAMERAAQQEMKGSMSVVKDKLVSIDFNHNPYSSNYDSTQTQIVNDRIVRVLSWYDNEWDFSCRMCDTAVALAKLL